MGYPYPPPYPYAYSYPPPKRNAGDMAISIIAMILIVLLGAIAAVIGLFSLAFLDHCPPQSCSVDGAVTAVLGALALAGLVGLTGIVLTIVALTRRKNGWPFAVGTLALCALVLFAGGVAYLLAVGG